MKCPIKSTASSLLADWTQENNELVHSWKQHEGGRGDAINQDQDHQNHLRCCSSKFDKLLRKIQGLPPLVDYAQLELTVVSNAGLCSAAQSQFSEAELLLTQATQRVMQMTGHKSPASDLPEFWRAVCKSEGNAALKSSVPYLLCLQWVIWLATCQLEAINKYQPELSSLLETLSTGVTDDRRNEAKGHCSDVPQLLTDPRRLIELLQICTIIAQGAERLIEGRSSEVLCGLHAASSLPAPRTLLAYTHLLSGSCLAQMSRPHMALQCYREALETDPRCVCALYQSMLVYRQLGNTQAEIQALRLLHSVLMLPTATAPALAGSQLLSPSLLLRSQSLHSLLSVPSALSVLHSLAQKSVLHGRVAEGVESYLDLLAALHSENQPGVYAEVSTLPRLPELYLEAGAALLRAQRPADCMALCDEVISTTAELLPERLVLEEPTEGCEAAVAVGEDKVKMLLWVGAAYLLQGHCHSHMKDWKGAVTHYTRCINLLLKVHFKRKGFQPQIPPLTLVCKQGTDLYVIQRLKGLSLAGRGISFCQTEQLREALRDLQLGLHVLPDCAGAGLWCGEVLWRLGRREEAVACWERTWSLSAQSSEESLSVYLQEPRSGPVLDSAELRHRIQEFGITS